MNGVSLPTSDFTYTTATTATNAGTYNVTSTFSDPNYVRQSSTVASRIAQAPLSISAASSTKVYDGTTTVTDGATPTATGLFSTDSISGLTEAFLWPNAGVGNDPTQLIGSVTIHDSNGGNNYTVYKVNQGQGLITPATAIVSVTSIRGIIYNGTPQKTASYSAIGINSVALPISDLTLNTTHTDAGTYNDTWTFTDPNYVSQTGSVTDNITQATATILVTPTPDSSTTVVPR